MTIKRPEVGWDIRRVRTHPGEILLEEFMKPLNLTINLLSLDLRVPVSRINDIVHERRSITADTATRLSVYFGISAELWLNAQTGYDLSKIRFEKLSVIKPEVLPRSA